MSAQGFIAINCEGKKWKMKAHMRAKVDVRAKVGGVKFNSIQTTSEITRMYQ